MRLNLGRVTTVTPDDAGWSYAGLRVVTLLPGVPITMKTGGVELFVVPLSGRLGVAVSGAHEASFPLYGRPSVFTHITDAAYVGRDCVLQLLSADGAEVALPSARCEAGLPPAYLAASDAAVEVRGAASATRQVTSFGVPGVFDGAERLMVCELLTPPGNWSSYPPHKHDSTAECANEEIYYYRIAGGPDGFGLHRTYTGPEHEEAGLAALDETIVVHDGDVVLVPHGYHGPCVAAPGYPMYYLNVLAGPGPRSMAFCDDPAHGWLRESWGGAAPDPRCPMTSVAGPV
ncbi:MAG: iolB [Frankiales bacterium]|nr:iolB [Frankiales bacterium]